MLHWTLWSMLLCLALSKSNTENATNQNTWHSPPNTCQLLYSVMHFLIQQWRLLRRLKSPSKWDKQLYLVHFINNFIQISFFERFFIEKCQKIYLKWWVRTKYKSIIMHRMYWRVLVHWNALWTKVWLAKLHFIQVQLQPLHALTVTLCDPQAQSQFHV